MEPLPLHPQRQRPRRHRRLRCRQLTRHSRPRQKTYAKHSLVELVSSPTFRIAARFKHDVRPITYQGKTSASFTKPNGIATNVPNDISTGQTLQLVSSKLGGHVPRRPTHRLYRLPRTRRRRPLPKSQRRTPRQPSLHHRSGHPHPYQ